MKKSDSKIVEYYAKGHHRGFYPKKGEKHYKQLGNEVHITFTNGKKELFASGKFREEALSKMFNLVDSYLENKPEAIAK